MSVLCLENLTLFKLQDVSGGKRQRIEAQRLAAPLEVSHSSARQSSMPFIYRGTGSGMASNCPLQHHGLAGSCFAITVMHLFDRVSCVAWSTGLTCASV